MNDQPRRTRAAFRAGSRGALVLALGVLPFGAVYGVAVSQSGLDVVSGAASSMLIFAGAAQLSLLDLNVEDAAWLVAIGTALAINARFVLYSAALAPAFSEFPATWRWGLPYLITDQAGALSLIEYETETDPGARRWFFLGAAVTLFVFWQAGTLVGLVAGGEVPDGLQLEFIIPLMFTALAAPALTRRPAVVAAVVAVAVTVAASALPPGTNILVGGLCGIAAGALVDPGTSPEPSSPLNRGGSPTDGEGGGELR